MHKFDQCFQEGMRAAREGFPSLPECPHQDPDFAMWWKRGYSFRVWKDRATDLELRLKESGTTEWQPAALSGVPLPKLESPQRIRLDKSTRLIARDKETGEEFAVSDYLYWFEERMIQDFEDSRRYEFFLELPGEEEKQ